MTPKMTMASWTRVVATERLMNISERFMLLASLRRCLPLTAASVARRNPGAWRQSQLAIDDDGFSGRQARAHHRFVAFDPPDGHRSRLNRLIRLGHVHEGP